MGARHIPHVTGEDGIERKRCRGCRAYHPLSEFAKSRATWDRLGFACKDHRNRMAARRRAALKDKESLLILQGGACAICGLPFDPANDSSWIVDHCSVTGQNRSLLCNYCNVGLGYFKDSVVLLVRAIVYLVRHGCRNHHPLESEVSVSDSAGVP